MLLLIVAVAMAGCGLRRVENIQAPYVDSEYQPYARPGSASIVGTLSDRSIAGNAMTCADMDVELVPATTYTRETIPIIRAGRLPSGRGSPGDKTLLRSTIKKATCDTSGRFEFTGLAAGSWLIAVEMRLSSGESMAGAMLREVAVAAGEAVTVTFDDADFVAR